MSATALAPPRGASDTARWAQLGLGLLCMMAISSPQYVWTLFTRPFGDSLGATPAAIQWTFTLLVVLQTFFSPFQGWLVQRFGPRRLIALGAGLTGLAWVLASQVTTLLGLYLAYGVTAGLGTGIVYVGVVGLVCGWFPERRGFAAGVVAAGYGMGAILTTFPVASSLAANGLRPTLLTFGLVFGAVGVLAAAGLRAAPNAAARATPFPEAAALDPRDTPTRAMLRHPVFWLMFAMMTLMSTSGLMVTSQLATFAADFGLAHAMVFGFAAIPFALTLDRFANGLTRPFFGWVSDRVGREPTMALAFALEGCAMTAWLACRTDPLLFALLSGVVFFGWGEIFSLFPSTLTDTFGPRWATQNYGCLYIAQGLGAVLGAPMASYLHAYAGTWTPVFCLAIGADFVTAGLALFVLRPMRARVLAA